MRRKFPGKPEYKLKVFRPPRFTMIQTGSRVRLAEMPEWVASLPEESRRVFEFCLGRVYMVEEVDEQGLFVLDVSGDIDRRFGGCRNDIRVDAGFLEEML